MLQKTFHPKAVSHLEFETIEVIHTCFSIEKRDRVLNRVRSWLMTNFLTLTENLKSTAHLIFEKMDLHDGLLISSA